jgi:deoxyribodipyrimidine photo-lyase
MTVPAAKTTMTATAPPSNAASKKPTLAFHWFRNDLRVHDNPALVHSVKNHDVCVPVFVFDSTLYGDAARTVPYNSLKWGSKRAKFLVESVHDLRQQLQARQSGLVVAHGNLGEIFERLVAAAKDTYQVSVVTQEEPLKEERDAVKAVQGVLKRHNPKAARVSTVWGSTLYELKDLPFNEGLQNLPDVFTPFRTKVEKECKIPKPLPVPAFNRGVKFDDVVSALASRDAFARSSVSFMPTLETLGYTQEQIEYANSVDPRGVMEFVGGERRALERVKAYIWDDKSLLQSYFETRNGMLGPNYSTKFSPWLALGCLSARHVAMECHKYEEQVVKNKSTYWVVFELLWRDYCKFFCVKHGDKVFYLNGILSDRYDKKWSTFEKNFEAWKHGRTGYPLVDANMRELNATGWMSNRGRQNVCSFLAIDLGHDWRYGKFAYFMRPAPKRCSSATFSLTLSPVPM